MTGETIFEYTSEDTFHYMMLSRLQSDCEYFLNWGFGSIDAIWGLTIKSHINEMKRLWFILPIQPEWLLYSQILEYEQRMLNYIRPANYSNF